MPVDPSANAAKIFLRQTSPNLLDSHSAERKKAANQVWRHYRHRTRPSRHLSRMTNGGGQRAHDSYCARREEITERDYRATGIIKMYCNIYFDSEHISEFSILHSQLFKLIVGNI